MPAASSKAIVPVVAVIFLCASAAFIAGFAWNGEERASSAQLSRLRGASADVFTQEALRKALAAAEAPNQVQE